jgi:hypothetical protein
MITLTHFLLFVFVFRLAISLLLTWSLSIRKMLTMGSTAENPQKRKLLDEVKEMKRRREMCVCAGA